MPPKKQERIGLQEVFRSFSDGLKTSVRKPTIYAYVPHAKQTIFHSSTKKGRLYVGGNRGGKTVGGVVEDIYWLTGEHPFRETPKPPVRGRCVVVDLIEGLEKIALPEFTRWLPPSKLINGSWEDSYSKRERTLTLENGSFIEFMTYEQDVEKFAGTSRHFVHFDEDPPQSIFNECMARLIDTGGSYWITMTPLLGMASFVYDKIYLPGRAGNPDIDVIEVDMLDNPYISSVEAQRILGGFDEGERKAREHGEFIQVGGLAFKSFRPDIHVIPAELFPVAPLNWTQHRSMDHGLNNPSAWHYHAVAPSGILITWDELYEAELTVPTWAARLHERDRKAGRRSPDISVGDPAIKQRSAHQGLSIQTAYAQEGIPLILGNNDQKFGVMKMNNYWHDLRWFITDKCPKLIQQAQRARWEVWATSRQRDQNDKKETLHSHNTHAVDSARYEVATIMPDITVDRSKEVLKKAALEVVAKILSPVTGSVASQVYDTALSKSLRSGNARTEWTSVSDENLGGEY